MQLTKATQRPERKDKNGVYFCVVSVAFVALLALSLLRSLTCFFQISERHSIRLDPRINLF